MVVTDPVYLMLAVVELYNSRNYLEHGMIFKGYSPYLCQFSTPSLPLSVQTLSWKTKKELQKLWKNENSLKKTCILYLFLVCLFIFQSITQKDDNKMTSKCPVLSCRDHTEKDVHLAKTHPSLVHSCSHCS